MSLLLRYAAGSLTRSSTPASFYRASLTVKRAKAGHKELWTKQCQWVGISSSAPSQVESALPVKVQRLERITRILSTLNPEKMGVQDITDISGRHKVAFTWLSDDNGSLSRTRVSIVYKLRYQDTKPDRRPFPPDTCGFLYFRRSAHSHVAAGEIRFRVIREEDRNLPFHSMFSRGSDLISYDGSTPWRLRLIRILKHYPGFRHPLLKDGFIKPTDEDKLEGLLKGVGDGRGQVLESIADPFLVDLGTETPSLTILHEEKIYAGRISCFFCKPTTYYKSEKMYKVEPPSSGKLLVRFEVAQIPRGRKNIIKLQTKIVLRILKIVERPKPEDAEIADKMFKEGELVQSVDLRTGMAVGPWSANGRQDFMTPSSLKVLEELYLKS